MPLRHLFLWSLAATLLTPPAHAQIQFNDATSASGIEFVHTDGSKGKHFMIESMTAGLALLDYDLDGDDDIYFLNGRPLDETPSDPGPRNALYRNDGDWRFTDVTAQAGVGNNAFGLGVASADYDNDGDPDLYLSNFGENVLYRNNGDGTFTDATSAAGVKRGYRTGGGVSFLDIDNDGDLDLYAANYIQFDVASQSVHMHKGVPAYPSPLRFDPEPDHLFENLGDGTFRDISQASGIASVAGRGMGCVAFDYDNDGDCDIAVANDSQENFLFENNGDRTFTETGLLAGIAYDFRGKSQASMGIDVFDYDRDGLFDLYMTSLHNEYASLYRNLGDGFFEDATRTTMAGDGTFAHVTWGVVAADFDLDSAIDLFIAAGHLDDNLHLRGGTSQVTGFEIRDIVLQNLGAGEFRDLKENWGTAARVARSGRGLVGGDLDLDGDIDLVVLNSRTPPTLLRNDTPRHDRSFVALRLVGRRANRQAIGAVVEVEQGERHQWDTRVSGCSYQSDCSKNLLFGVAGAGEVTVTIRWPAAAGHVQTLKLQPGQTATVVEPRELE